MKLSSRIEHQDVEIFKFGSWPFGRPKMFSHLFFVDGLLIDTGHSGMRKEIWQAVSPLAVEQIFITHHHEDHTGNLAILQSHFACPALASAKCVELMKDPPSISFAQWLTWGPRPAFRGLTETMDRINTPKYTFEIYPIPGHAEDMLCLYERERGWLFSADLWVSDRIRYFMRAESVHEQIVSIQKVLELDFDVLFCSHNPQFEGGKQRLQKKLQFFQDFYGKVAEQYHRGLTPQRIMQALALKENWNIRLTSGGELSTLNMIKAVIRDEQLRAPV
ncbi:MAG: MBL fold metallo-hydrolase [Saprospiraceae bacterium]|nr:MBL fold metallo-hydrolase [Saprospiraceae bacterium]